MNPLSDAVRATHISMTDPATPEKYAAQLLGFPYSVIYYFEEDEGTSTNPIHRDSILMYRRCWNSMTFASYVFVPRVERLAAGTRTVV